MARRQFYLFINIKQACWSCSHSWKIKVVVVSENCFRKAWSLHELPMKRNCKSKQLLNMFKDDTQASKVFSGLAVARYMICCYKDKIRKLLSTHMPRWARKRKIRYTLQRLQCGSNSMVQLLLHFCCHQLQASKIRLV